MTRTFSKIYGLGGARVGWAYGPQEIIDVLNRVRGPFNVSTTALAGAEAAVRDTDYVERCRLENAKWRGWLADQLAELGVPSDTSCTNFILARFASQSEAESCDDFLKQRGLIVRRVAGYNLPTALRITIGDETACRAVAAAVKDFKAGAAE
jgi:histidinol-phosphate aminotransferase